MNDYRKERKSIRELRERRKRTKRKKHEHHWILFSSPSPPFGSSSSSFTSFKSFWYFSSCEENKEDSLPPFHWLFLFDLILNWVREIEMEVKEQTRLPTGERGRGQSRNRSSFLHCFVLPWNRITIIIPCSCNIIQVQFADPYCYCVSWWYKKQENKREDWAHHSISFFSSFFLHDHDQRCVCRERERDIIIKDKVSKWTFLHQVLPHHNWIARFFFLSSAM